MNLTKERVVKNQLLVMREMKQQDFGKVRRWCRDEGWNLGLHDAATYFRADPHGHHLFFENNDPIGSISLVKHDKNFYSLGPFIVTKDHRHQGYGDQIWQSAFALANQNPEAMTLLYAVAAQVPRYEKQGFRQLFVNQRWQQSANTPMPLSSEYSCKRITSDALPEICQYDKAIFSTSRQRIFSETLKQKNTNGFFIRDDNKILGFGIIRPCINGYRIGPLMADSVDIARALFAQLAHSIGNKLIIMDVPEGNQEANKLLGDLGLELKPEHNTIAMIKGTPSTGFIKNFIRHYAIFSLEIG